LKAAKWLKQMLVLTMLFTGFSGGAAYAEEGPESEVPAKSLRTPAFPGAEGGGKYTTHLENGNNLNINVMTM